MLTLKLTWKTIFSSMIRNRSYHNFPSIPEINYIPRNDLPDDDDDHLWTDIYRRQQPVVIRSLVSHWNAVSDPQRRWVDLKRLRDRVAASSNHDQSIVVPVEIGDSYMDENLSKHLIEFPDLLDCYIATTTKSCHDNIGDHTESSKHSITMPRIYLAQHDIDEISVLKDDILIPRICNTGKGSMYRKNIWFGSPQGTVSPCHYDPFHNILCQVIGKKEVILFDPSLSSYLYPALHTVQKNTSQVDISRPDLTNYPLYKEILSLVDSDKGGIDDESVVSCHSVGRTILYPGDAVYIPLKWWHYCKTSELSCSVNFWWL